MFLSQVLPRLVFFISFTGSKKVGKIIYENASKVYDGQIWLKRVIAEMGGKDAILVDNNADLELAAESIVKSSTNIVFLFCGSSGSDSQGRYVR